MMNVIRNGALAGLTEEEAAFTHKDEGYNKLPSSIKRSLGAVAFEVIHEPMFLPRRVPATESRVGATVFCVDKTRTFTLNVMSVSRIYAQGSFFSITKHRSDPLPETFREIVGFAILADQSAPSNLMERALKQTAEGDFAQNAHIRSDWVMV